jgi:tRNA(adenine34) deaminase
VGAVLVKNNKLIAKAHNQPILNNDPTAHAEIQLLRKAGKILANSTKRLFVKEIA